MQLLHMVSENVKLTLPMGNSMEVPTIKLKLGASPGGV